MGLELYGKIEDLFLDKEAAHILWSKFISVLISLDVKNILDIGCGSGDFCELALNSGLKVKGIDLSHTQIERAKIKCDCEVKDVCDMEDKFEAAVAIFDVINYMNDKELKKFFSCVENVVEKYFIFDINSYFAMNDLAIGTLKAEDENRFGVLYSDFEDDVLTTEITLFEKDGGCYKKSQANIIQYYHSIEKISKFMKMKLINKIPVSLYGSGEIEKWILVFEK
ncbi:class I SAM-dependent methyltransferase [Nautilia sp. PV-1]|jgi:SAM-dependent methyltransferase|uniref:class I SAM-dependent methyltransferase n=1 Tax=Nautilia sp. PV-1 TaxID=2579250 RepID=UPI000FDA0F46|nr:class I SAM-dependent methyltransferase [Nautilia sp. PV-1]AZV46319.1 class I SAM-dependent methyltransferase [Nautilia sp. PV-1]